MYDGVGAGAPRPVGGATPPEPIESWRESGWRTGTDELIDRG
jgi:hypothetical protein